MHKINFRLSILHSGEETRRLNLFLHITMTSERSRVVYSPTQKLQSMSSTVWTLLPTAAYSGIQIYCHWRYEVIHWYGGVIFLHTVSKACNKEAGGGWKYITTVPYCHSVLTKYSFSHQTVWLDKWGRAQVLPPTLTMVFKVNSTTKDLHTEAAKSI